MAEPFDMHMHVRKDALMRTTVEIKDKHRSKLLEYAARRGEKGFSRIVGEALDLYFERETDRKAKIESALGVLGSLSDDEADALSEEAQRLRSSWRSGDAS